MGVLGGGSETPFTQLHHDLLPGYARSLALASEGWIATPTEPEGGTREDDTDGHLTHGTWVTGPSGTGGHLSHRGGLLPLWVSGIVICNLPQRVAMDYDDAALCLLSCHGEGSELTNSISDANKASMGPTHGQQEQKPFRELLFNAVDSLVSTSCFGVLKAETL